MFLAFFSCPRCLVVIYSQGLMLLFMVYNGHRIGANWGKQLTHPLPPSTVVQLLKDNGTEGEAF
ncbi:hypothetical protein OROGR_005392 [Orobanche gracilis]